MCRAKRVYHLLARQILFFTFASSSGVFNASTLCDNRHAAPAGGRFVHFTSHWTDAFSCFQPNSSGLAVGIIERFVILIYDFEIPGDNVNKVRQTLFTEKGREIESLPLTKDALRQHVLRVGYQTGHVWGHALLKAPQLASEAGLNNGRGVWASVGRAA